MTHRPLNESPSTLETNEPERADGQRPPPEALALVVAWARDDPSRLGETSLFAPELGVRLLGRGGSLSGERAVFVRQRPGVNDPCAPIEDQSISREQLRVSPTRDALVIERVGRCPMRFAGARVDRVELSPGQCVSLEGRLLLLCARRPRVMAGLRDFPWEKAGRFGEPDAFGLLGESPEAWRLRDAVGFQARAGAHVLVLGESGAGKELVARATHLLSARSHAPFVARNAATLPEGLVDAELFGTAKNYPNAGMPERPGLIGAADGGTLFLDEIGEMPSSLHANLLRVLDGDGEYHRLGDARARRADLRLIAATNRAPESLKHDLLARLPLRQTVPGLDARREDIALLVRHLLRRALARSPELVARFVDGAGEPRVTIDLIEHLVGRAYTTHVRELDGLLWRAMTASAGSVIELPHAMARESTATAAVVARSSPPRAPVTAPPDARDELTEERLRASLSEHGGNLVRAARALGLPSRYALYRLLRKHAIDVRAMRARDGDDG
jgi:DNA-binding NtrC family response regulator